MFHDFVEGFVVFFCGVIVGSLRGNCNSTGDVRSGVANLRELCAKRAEIRERFAILLQL